MSGHCHGIAHASIYIETLVSIPSVRQSNVLFSRMLTWVRSPCSNKLLENTKAKVAYQ